MSSVAVHRILARLQNVKTSGRGWTARCSAHEDRSPSLSVAEGEDGRTLLHCYAGCAPEAILAALGLSLRDLFEAPSRRGPRGMADAQGPQTLWAAVRRDLREERRRLLALEGEVADGIREAYWRVFSIRRAVTALGRDDETGFDLLADAAALERAALSAEVELDHLRETHQAADFSRRGLGWPN